MRCKNYWLAILLVASLLAPRLALAFADSTQFFANAALPHSATVSASSEGIYFTGAPRFAGQNCAACHVDGPGKIGIKVGADVTSLFSNGYVPGQTYVLEVELLGETQGLSHTGSCTAPPTPLDHYAYVQCNNNNYALEIDTPRGPLAGGFCASAPSKNVCPAPNPFADESLVAPAGDAAFGNRAFSATPGQSYILVRNDPRIWHLWWTAPAAGTGPLTLRVAMVDGNGGSGAADNDQDPDDDDTVQAAIPIAEAGVATHVAQPSCAFTMANRPNGTAPVLGAIAWLLLAYGIRRRSST